MVLSDGTILDLIERERLVVKPWDPRMLQPASIDLKLGNSFLVARNHDMVAMDIKNPPQNYTEEVKVEDGQPFVLHTGEFVLGTTAEWVEIPDDVVAHIEGKSSLGRIGLIVHATAGFVDPGFRGDLTLEITNLSTLPIVLWPGRPVAQLCFMALDRPAERPYGHPELGSHYQDQKGVTEAKIG